MSSQTVSVIETETPPTGSPLLERLDPVIGETSTMVGAMLSELVRRTLRGSILQIEGELQGNVARKVDATISSRMAAVESAATEVADKAARIAATEVAVEEVHALERRTVTAQQQLRERLTEVVRTAQTSAIEMAQQLGSRIETVEENAKQVVATTADALTNRIATAEQRTDTVVAATAEQLRTCIVETRTEVARELGCRIETVEQKTETAVASTAEQLARQIEEAERRADTSAREEIARQINDVVARSRKTVAEMKDRLGLLETGTVNLEQRLGEERQARETGHSTLRSELTEELRRELSLARATIQTLTDRIIELERPRGLRALWARWFGRGKRNRAAI